MREKSRMEALGVQPFQNTEEKIILAQYLLCARKALQCLRPYLQSFLDELVGGTAKDSHASN